MFELFRFKRDIPFMRYGKLTTAFSLITFILAVFFLSTRGLNWSIEFSGGTVMELRYPQAIEVAKIREQIHSLSAKEFQVQYLGSTRDVWLRLAETEPKFSQQIFEKLKIQSPALELRKVDFIGPQVGKELFSQGMIALSMVCLGIMLYLAIRFEWRIAVAAIVANLHDVVIILGCFAFFQWEFSLTVLAAVLAVLGYSVNESVVVFDRIRETFRKSKLKDTAAVIDHAITATMSRTVITHGSTEAMVLSMLLFGGPSLYYFALALTIGILFGIYSSVLVASPLALWLGVSREHFIKEKKIKQDVVI
jgi:preprotein translocase subunit SecF